MIRVDKPAVGALEVRVYGVRVGELSVLDGGRTRFTPDAAWLEGGQHPPLGLSFLTDPRARFATGAAPAWFENLLPERGSRLRAWICKQRGLRDTNSLALLAALGGDLPGAVEIGGEANGEGLTGLEREMTTRLRFSLAGVQLKLSMLLSGDRFVLPAKDRTGDWIVKIPSDRFPELPDVEDATMAWARASGFITPEFYVLSVDRLDGVDPELLGRPVKAFAVKRFDRSNQGRVHQEDFAQALDVRPEQKYGEDSAMTYDGMARLVRDVCDERTRDDFIERLAFVVASGNDDAHLKNWSFQWGHGHRPALSPCYDMVATISWGEFGWARKGGPALSHSMGKEKYFADLDLRCLDKFVERTKVLHARDTFLGALERVRLSWGAVAERAPRCMVEALDAHWQRVPILRYVGPLPSTS